MVKGKAGAAYRVQGFKEKPDKPTADRYVESGGITGTAACSSGGATPC
jgi:mannose-1-phosphate guanylyltransferase